MMSELELFAKITLEKDGIWRQIEKNGRYAMYKTQDRYMYKNEYRYNSPVYQIFCDGKRVFASINRAESYAEYKRLIHEQENER